MDRCDTPAHWFCLADGVPYFACIDEPHHHELIKDVAKQARGYAYEVSRRVGNHARATLDELCTAWPGAPRHVADDGSFLLVEPCEVVG